MHVAIAMKCGVRTYVAINSNSEISAVVYIMSVL